MYDLFVKLFYVSISLLGSYIVRCTIVCMHVLCFIDSNNNHNEEYLHSDNNNRALHHQIFNLSQFIANQFYKVKHSNRTQNSFQTSSHSSLSTAEIPSTPQRHAPYLIWHFQYPAKQTIYNLFPPIPSCYRCHLMPLELNCKCLPFSRPHLPSSIHK